MERATQRSGYLRLASPDIGDAELGEIAEAVRSGWVTTGPRVERLERRLEGYLRAPHVRCTASCTAAMQLALRMAGIGRGDEVLVPAMTFVSCANVVEHAGARPVLVDCDPATGHLDLAHGPPRAPTVRPASLPFPPPGPPLARTPATPSPTPFPRPG